MKKLTIIMVCGLISFSCKNDEKRVDHNQSDSTKVGSSEKSESAYTCPMHPEVVRKEAGVCPECGMELQILS